MPDRSDHIFDIFDLCFSITAEVKQWISLFYGYISIFIQIKMIQVQLTLGTFSVPSPSKQTKTKSRSRPGSAASLSNTPSPPLSSSLLFNSAEDVIRADICSPPDIIQTIRNNPHLRFLYMMSSVPKSSIKYDPYNLK